MAAAMFAPTLPTNATEPHSSRQSKVAVEIDPYVQPIAPDETLIRADNGRDHAGRPRSA